jgi:hypothetical protein
MELKVLRDRHARLQTLKSELDGKIALHQQKNSIIIAQHDEIQANNEKIQKWAIEANETQGKIQMVEELIKLEEESQKEAKKKKKKEE